MCRVKGYRVLPVVGLLLLVPVSNFAEQDPQRILQPVGKERVALVIGNDAYTTAPLKNPVNDARAIAATLTESGFQVTLAVNTGQREMERAVDRFIRELGPGKTGVFYYAGHGMQIEGENYLAPIDFVIRDEADAKYSAYSASRVVERMEKTGAGLSIVILDACRNNPFVTTRSSSNGLALMSSGEGIFIAFATAPGKTAADNPRGANGLFTTHLLTALKERGLTLDQVFSKVRERVATASDRKQIPWTSSSVIGDFYFNPPSEGKTPVKQVGQPGRIATKNSSRPIGGDRWEWTVFVEADPETLSLIECVEYTLHQTFPEPVRKVCAGGNFALRSNGWGTFEIKIRVLFRDGTVRRLAHMLEFK